MAIMNGMAQGAQPLISESFGKGASGDVKKLLRWALTCAAAIEIVMVALVWTFTDPFIAVFNSENNQLLLEYAHTGLRLYFLGFLFAGVNIMLVAYFSATANPRPAIIGSLLRGAIAIGICAMKGYEMLGGHLDKKGVVISSVIMVVMIYFGNRIAWSWDAYDALKDQGFTFFDSYQYLGEILDQTGLAGDYYTDRAIGYVLSFVCGARYIIHAFRASNGSYTMKKH